MNEPIFLFHGGMYKRGVDDERKRVPMAPHEADLLFYDPHVPYDTDNSIRTELDMGRYAELWCHLEVGDEIYVGLLPDAALYRGIWAMAFNAVPGFKVEFDLVRIRDVWNALVNNRDLKGIRAMPMPGGRAFLPYDFTDGVGMSPYQAMTLAKLPYGKGSYDAYRNNAALKYAPIDPDFFAQLGESMYIRMTVKELGEFGNIQPDGCCSNCHESKYPKFQVGVVYDRLCVDKARWTKYCNCDQSFCAEGCDTPPPPPSTYTIIPVTFKDNQGNTIRPDDIVRIYENAVVTVTPPMIDGYIAPQAMDVTVATGKVEFVYTPV